MKKLILYTLPFLLACNGTFERKVEIGTPSENPNEESTETSEVIESVDGYDSLLAKKYEADQYGMKAYVMAFLKKGPNRPTDSLKAAELQEAHMNNIGRLAEEGKLVLAGPFFGEGDLRGIYIFNTPSLDSAKAYTESDPAIIHGSLVMELHPWYGSAALMAVNELHAKISEINI